jgi:Cgl0159-like
VHDEQRQAISDTRARNPAAVAEAAAKRQRRPWLGPSGRLMLIAADHTARGMLGAGSRPMAMASRTELLDRILVALDRPGVDGVLGTADIIDDLLLLGALDDKVVLGSMNRAGLTGSVFEIDDQFTGYTAGAIVAGGLDGGKMLLRIDLNDPATASALNACASAVNELAERQLPAVIEPFLTRRAGDRLVNDLSPDAVIRSVTIASGLGATSAYTWLKIPVIEEMDRVAESFTLPALLLGGEVMDRPDEMFARWRHALTLPGVYGLVVGRSLLYPPDDDVAAAVDTAVSLL